MTLSNNFVIADEPLQKKDPDVYQILQNEQKRQYEGLELVASEVMHYFVYVKFVFPLY